MEQYIWLTLFGMVIGVFGTLIGAGGGFILTPALLLLYPNDSPNTITSISLAVTFANALSGSVAYARMGRIRFRYGIMFSLAAVPGAILGSLGTAYVSRRLFDLVFAMVLIAASAYIFTHARVDSSAAETESLRLSRSKTWLGILISVVVGFASSFLGIGGGIIHVPALVTLLGFPVHASTATSHFILATTAGTGTLVHILSGAFAHGVRRTIALALGVLVGAQIGARLSTHIKGRWIIRALAVALASIGVRLLVQFARGS